MKAILLIAALAGFSIYSPADPFRLEGVPFHPSTNSEIVWSVQTNALPRGLWIYKVMPEAFSAAVVSNAMTIGHFQMRDLSKGEYPLLKDKHSIYFYNKNESNRPRFLFIAPTLGAMQYSSQRTMQHLLKMCPAAKKQNNLQGMSCFNLA